MPLVEGLVVFDDIREVPSVLSEGGNLGLLPPILQKLGLHFGDQYLNLVLESRR